MKIDIGKVYVMDGDEHVANVEVNETTEHGNVYEVILHVSVYDEKSWTATANAIREAMVFMREPKYV